MASLTQIGAVIGISGSKQYMNDLKKLTQYTKEFAAENEKLATTFTKGVKTMETVNQQRKVLQDQIEATTNVLNREKEELGKLNAKKREDAALTQEEANKFSALQTDINKTTAELNRLNNEMDDLPADNFIGKLDLIKQNLANNNSELKQWGDLLKGVGETMTKYVTLPVVAGFTASVKAATDWESALNGVRKTTDMTKEEMNALEAELKTQALQTTYTSTELANVAQIAGQLGVRGVEGISKFVSVVADLGIATDLTADEAATNLARIFNITEHGDYSNLEAIASVIVHLGNNLATTEPEITAMANRMASAASIVGFTTKDIFALSGALTSVGITAEAGGSTVGQVLTNIDKQIAQFTKDGTGNLEQIATISNMSADEFVNAWKNEPVKAFEAFINGLANLDDETENINIILDDLDMAGIRQSNMLKALAEAQAEGVNTTQLFTKALGLAEYAYSDYNALEAEASIRRNESATSFANLVEAVTQLGQAFGKVLLPIVVPIVKWLTEMINKFANLDESTKKIILVIAGIAAAIGPVLAVAGQILTLISSISIIATTLGVTIGALVAPIGIVVASIAGMIAAGVLLINHWNDIKATFELLGMIVQEIGRRIGEFLKNLAISILEGLLSLFETIVAKFLLFTGSTLPNFVNNIKTTFTNLISSAWNWGSDLVGNIISGIQSKFSSLLNSVKNIANTIWSYLHFSEPEVGALSDFNTWMPDMMKGLAKGIDDNIYLVDNAISRVADSLASPNQVNYGGVVINLNVPQGANGQQIVDEIESELASRTIRRRAVFG